MNFSGTNKKFNVILLNVKDHSTIEESLRTYVDFEELSGDN